MTKDQKPPKDATPNADVKVYSELNVSKGKAKKIKNRKRHHSKSQSSVSSSSISEVGSVPPLDIDEAAKEQFYDAHESYHGWPENPLMMGSAPRAAVVSTPTPPTLVSVAVPSITTALLVVQSEHTQDSKTQASATTPHTQSARRAKKACSTVTKPVTRLQ